MRRAFCLLLVLLAAPSGAQEQLDLLNEEERAWLQALDRPLRVGSEPNYHPYNFVDEQGELSGVVSDYLKLLGERLDVEFEAVILDTFVDVLDAARTRDVDIVPLIVAAPERRSFLDFSQPVYETSDRIFVRQETEGEYTLEDLAGMRVGIIEGYALWAVVESGYPDIELVAIPTEPDGLLAVSLGSIDAFISEIGTSSYYIEELAITNLRIAGAIDAVDQQTFGTRNDLPILNSIIGKGLASITPEEHTEIQRRWINVGGVDSEELELLWKRVRTVVAVTLVLFAAVLVWTFSLRRLVARREKELQREFAERRALEASKARLAIAVEQSAEFVLVIDTDGVIEYANRSFVDAFGRSSLRGTSFSSLAAEDNRRDMTDALETARAFGGWRGEVPFANADKDSMKIAMNVAPIFNERAEIDGYVVTGRDVTREEEVEARLRQGERLSALGTLAGGIAHDFNNLLVPIIGYTDLLRSETSEESAPLLDGISSASERARDLVQRIMIFGRGGTGEMRPLDIRFEIEDAISFVRHLLPKTIALEERLEDSGAVFGDRAQIQQILVNLCSNASAAMAGAGGSLKISLEPRTVPAEGDPRIPELMAGDYAVLTVVDTGVGMDEETRSRIFDPYFSSRQESGGTGLGLAIVHGVVTRHGGFIDVQSAPKAGTTFRIYLPGIAAEPSGTDVIQTIEVPKGRGQRILIVDDDTLVLETVRNMIKGLGYETDAYSEPDAAFDAFAAEPDRYDAILADLSMPGQTGLQLLDRVRAVRDDIPAAIMTGNVSAMQDADVPCISKPMQLANLSECLRDLLRPTA